MRPVNLLPSRYRPARASGERRGIGYIAIGILVALLVMVLLVVVTNNGINDAKQKTAQANADYQAAQAKIGQLQAYGDFAALRQARYDAVKNVAVTRFDYERLMREIALVLPHNSNLTSFTASSGASGGTLGITGCAPSHPGVATVIVRLRHMHNVTDVTLGNSTKNGSSSSTGTTTGGCPVSWTATVTLGPETTAASTERVPARLGGGQ